MKSDTGIRQTNIELLRIISIVMIVVSLLLIGESFNKLINNFANLSSLSSLKITKI